LAAPFFAYQQVDFWSFQTVSSDVFGKNPPTALVPSSKGKSEGITFPHIVEKVRPVPLEEVACSLSELTNQSEVEKILKG
jgi:hypothetical protein